MAERGWSRSKGERELPPSVSRPSALVCAMVVATSTLSYWHSSRTGAGLLVPRGLCAMSASGTKLTLQLLQGPTAALVSSAVAGVASGVCLTRPAHCASYHLIPYDDDVFQVRCHVLITHGRGFQPLPGSCKALCIAGCAAAVSELTLQWHAPPSAASAAQGSSSGGEAHQTPGALEVHSCSGGMCRPV